MKHLKLKVIAPIVRGSERVHDANTMMSIYGRPPAEVRSVIIELVPEEIKRKPSKRRGGELK